MPLMVCLTVKIKKAQATDWYATRIGETVEVYRWANRYVVAADFDAVTAAAWRFIEPKDVEVA